MFQQTSLSRWKSLASKLKSSVMISLFGIDLKRFLRVFVSKYGRSLNLKTIGCHELIILIRSSGNALCFRCWEYSAAPLTLSPVFHLTQIKFSDAKTKKSCSSTSFLLFFYARFSNQGNPSSPLFQIQQCKDKDTTAQLILLSLSSHIWVFQYNAIPFFSSLILHFSSRQNNLLSCVLLFFFPPFYNHRFCIFPTRLPAGSV